MSFMTSSSFVQSPFVVVVTDIDYVMAIVSCMSDMYNKAFKVKRVLQRSLDTFIQTDSKVLRLEAIKQSVRISQSTTALCALSVSAMRTLSFDGLFSRLSIDQFIDVYTLCLWHLFRIYFSYRIQRGTEFDLKSRVSLLTCIAYPEELNLLFKIHTEVFESCFIVFFAISFFDAIEDPTE